MRVQGFGQVFPSEAPFELKRRSSETALTLVEDPGFTWTIVGLSVVFDLKRPTCLINGSSPMA
jgi:hypothetical protein